MKTKLCMLFTLLFSIVTIAQNGINYKAVVKDGSGNIIANDLISVQFTVIETSAVGTTVYQESHTPTTDNNGVIVVNIGEGTPLSGTFENIDWANDLHFLNVQVNTGSGLVDLGTTEFKDVPYAIAASKVKLPYFDRKNTASTTAAFHVHNDNTNATFGIVGTTGTDGASIPANRAGVFGYSTNAHGVYGRSENSFYAGVQGVSNSAEGVGVQGYGFGGGVGGHFYTTSVGIAALTTGRGNVGIGIDEPEYKLHVGGDMLVQTNLGELIMGFPDNGNQWQFGTRGAGADLQFQSKLNGVNNFTTRFRMLQNGEFQVGDIGTPSAWMHIEKNSTLSKPHLKLEEVGNDFARLELTNNATNNSYWHVAGLPSNTTADARLNFYFRNASGAANRMTITGDGQVGINGTPTARLELYQQSQTVGTGLRFDDGTANSDWDITHGFSLRFHYGGSLRGFINANTGAYTQSSDVRLKNNIQELPSVLNRVEQIRPTTYNYKTDESNTPVIGLIAQEVQKIFPEVVSYSKADDVYGIDYASFSVVAIKAIQEQQNIIKSMEERLAALENKK